MREETKILTHNVSMVGQVVRLQGDLMITCSGETRDSYNSRLFRPIMFDPLDVRRHAPDKRETCHNLTKLAQMAETQEARMAYEKQYAAMARRYLARKMGRVTVADDGIRRISETQLQPSKE